MTSMPLKRDTSRKFARVDQLVIDPEVQRELRPPKVKSIRQNLDLDAIGIITVSRRKDGTLVVLDGQHRIVALREEGHGSLQVGIHIHDGLTRAQEASLFRLLNNTNRPTAFDDFVVGVVARDPECIGIEKIVGEAGYRIHNQTVDGAINAVSALRRVYRGSNGHGPHPEHLTQTLKIISAAWGHTAPAVEGQILQGLGVVVETYGDELDTAALTRKLAKYPGGASGLLGKARQLKDIRRTSVARSVAEIVVDSYNSGRRKRLAAA